MGFWRDIGKGLGELTGTIVGGSVGVIGDLTGSKFVQEVGEGLYRSAKVTGERLGQATEGIWNVGAGVATQDSAKIDNGLINMGSAISDTIHGISSGIRYTVSNGADVVEGLIDKDYSRAQAGTRNLAKTAAIIALAITPIDLIADGLDGIDTGTDSSGDAVVDETASADTTIENPNTHHVTPFWRHSANGEAVWVDGIDDPTVHSTTGWTQHNPDYRVTEEE